MANKILNEMLSQKPSQFEELHIKKIFFEYLCTLNVRSYFLQQLSRNEINIFKSVKLIHISHPILVYCLFFQDFQGNNIDINITEIYSSQLTIDNTGKGKRKMKSSTPLFNLRHMYLLTVLLRYNVSSNILFNTFIKLGYQYDRQYFIKFLKRLKSNDDKHPWRPEHFRELFKCHFFVVDWYSHFCSVYKGHNRKFILTKGQIQLSLTSFFKFHTNKNTAELLREIICGKYHKYLEKERPGRRRQHRSYL
eukprot:TRINITY_DN3209_c1_g1_i1.p1 TRINITY_DN3209_c1_g1~~TRINITY_DN3209_c1_g1_i1.p1  ORF type:complete len:250 (-),score=8.03 TRINITY_DN3209_c1_g1_i1:520-1269(-)